MYSSILTPAMWVTQPRVWKYSVWQAFELFSPPILFLVLQLCVYCICTPVHVVRAPVDGGEGSGASLSPHLYFLETRSLKTITRLGPARPSDSPVFTSYGIGVTACLTFSRGSWDLNLGLSQQMLSHSSTPRFCNFFLRSRLWNTLLIPVLFYFLRQVLAKLQFLFWTFPVSTGDAGMHHHVLGLSLPS